MEISPIPGIRGLPGMKAGRASFELPSVFSVDPSAKPGDGDRQANGRKGAGAEENEKDDLQSNREGDGGDEKQEEAPKRNVDYFA